MHRLSISYAAAAMVALGRLNLVAIASAQEPASRPPNIVIVFTDDQGYADVGCYGAEGFETPHLDRLAREGMRFTDFYVAQAVCSASRAGLLTGCYPNRIGIQGALGPGARHGIHEDEITIAEALRERGYATAIYGKWHLGHHPKFLPRNHGFDDYFGLPYSNDMWPHHPTNQSFPDLPLIALEETVELNPDQRKLTTWHTERAVQFIDKHKDRPFFLYVPHSMPHVPLFVSDKHEGTTSQGIYGDVIAEIDWSVGQITAALARHGLAENTLVVFTSDNGPWLSYGDHGGSAGPLREGKGTTFEGGVRVPAIFHWPGKIPAGRVCREPVMTIDLLPTLVRLAGGSVSDNRPIDGKDIWPLVAGHPDARSPHEALYFYWGRHLQAVRSGKWKLHFPHNFRSLTGTPGSGGRPGGYTTGSIDLALFDLQADVGETTNLAEQHPEIVARLKALAERARADLGDSATGKEGANVRPAGKL